MRVGILKGITVVECSTFVTGPYAARLLGDLGARVIKIESPVEGDPYRYFAPDPFFSPNFAHLNSNKESLALDLKTKNGKEITTRLIKQADVFIENFRPGAAHRLGKGIEKRRAQGNHQQLTADSRRLTQIFFWPIWPEINSLCL